MKAQRAVALAPAKLNLGLEVIGRQDDGYHQVVSILQCISLFDVLDWSSRGEPFTYRSPASIDPGTDLVSAALATADDAAGWTGTLTLRKSIPSSAGLGGGSSDAALALRIAHLGRPIPDLDTPAAGIGSDVPFFLRGGTALATGTGTTLSPLPSPRLWFVVVTPRIVIPSKTPMLYLSLRSDDFSDGSEVRFLAESFRQNAELSRNPPNAFARQLLDYSDVRTAWAALERAGAPWVGVSGAGLSLYSAVPDFPSAASIARRVPHSVGTINVAQSLAAQHGDTAAKNLALCVRGGRSSR